MRFQPQKRQQIAKSNLKNQYPSSYKQLNFKYTTPRNCQFKIPSSISHQMQHPPIKQNRDHKEESSPASIIDCTLEKLRKSIDKNPTNDICNICGEKIGASNFAVLSCSHVFHYSCIKSFCSMFDYANHRCPVCKKEYVFKNVCADDAMLKMCATKIQRVFRGYMTRRNIENSASKYSTLYQFIIMRKASKNNRKLVGAIEDQNDAVDAFLASIDKELEFSRSLMRAVEEKEKATNWDAIRNKVRKTGFGKCGICLREIEESECAITSCTHCFHSKCLNAWKDFCLSQQRQPTCPMCRSFFESRDFAVKQRMFELPMIHLYY